MATAKPTNVGMTAMNSNKQKELIRSLAEGTRLQYSTKEAAFFLNIREDTMRAWACFGKGDIKPRKVGNRLAWMADDIRRLMGMEAV